MADDKIQFSLDLDIKEFTEHALSAKGIIGELGNAENLTGLIEGLTSAGLVLGTVGIAAFAVKEAIDWTIEGEQINRVNEEFKYLATNAGIAADALKEGLKEASNGLLTEQDLLKVANEAIVKMGTSAEKLPEIMELARKATLVFGGDLKSNFENITNAVANGNARMLKHYGIIVDTNKAYADFAEKNGLAVNALSQTAKHQALLNAVLEQSDKNFKGISGDLNQTQDTMTQLKVTVSELKEMFVVAFEKTIGPTVRSALGAIKDFSTEVKSNFETSAGKTQQLEMQLKALQTRLALIKKEGEGNFLDDFLKGTKAEQIQKLNKDIAQTTQALAALHSTDSKRLTETTAQETKAAAVRSKASNDNLIDKKLQAANEAKFRKELEAIDKDYYKSLESQVTSFKQIEDTIANQRLMSANAHANKKKDIEASLTLDKAQKTKLLLAEDTRYIAQVSDQEKKLNQLRQTLLKTYVQNSTTAFQGIGRAFQLMSVQAKADFEDFGKRGIEVTQSFQQNASSSFQQIGSDIAKGKDIAQSAADGMKGFFLNMLADRAQGEGALMMASGIWPPNPIAIAGGAGLLTLAGALRGLAGGGGGASIPTPSVSGGAVTPPSTSNPGIPASALPIDQSSAIAAASSAPGTAEAAPTGMAQQQRERRSVNVNIAGNYMDTDATRRQLMELMRQETDATDFTYQKIGV